MAIRAKFVVTSVTTYETSGDASSALITLQPRYDSKIPEDQRFAEATPSGKLEMNVTIKPVIDQFKPGKVFYLDFTEAPAGTSRYHE
jgi:hypothetical protein